MDENVGRTESFGWTQMDIFDFRRCLRRGKWKCPIYYGPTDAGITKAEVKQLEPISGSWIYFRISFVNDDEYGFTGSLYPDHTMHEYIIPEMHLRNYGTADIEREPDRVE